jgi:hydrogenase maturation protease
VSLRLVAGIGHPDRGDDAAGLLAARQLEGRLPPGVELRLCAGDLLGLAQDWAGAELAVCIDALAPLGQPGRVHVLDGQTEFATGHPASSHGFGLAEAVALSRALGTLPEKLLIYGIEGADFTPGAAMSPEVACAVVEAARMILAAL